MTNQGDMFASEATPSGPKVVLSNRGDLLKSHGMRVAAKKSQPTLDRARDIAARIASERGTVTVDDVRAEMGIAPRKQNEGNWIGSLFRDSRFEATGQFRKSKLSTNHSRMIRVWRLKCDAT